MGDIRTPAALFDVQQPTIGLGRTPFLAERCRLDASTNQMLLREFLTTLSQPLNERREGGRPIELSSQMELGSASSPRRHPH